MRTSTLRSITLSAVLACAAVAAFAQTTSRPGEDNYPPGAPNAARPGVPPSGARVGPRYTPGWSMMSKEERAQHRSQMRAAKTPEECRQLMEEHHRLMERRAADRGTPLRTPPRAACPAR